METLVEGWFVVTCPVVVPVVESDFPSPKVIVWFKVDSESAEVVCVHSETPQCYVDQVLQILILDC